MSTFGPAYDETIDKIRIDSQMRRVLEFTLNHGWKTLFCIAQSMDCPESSASAQLRHLRKARFGGYTVEKRRVFMRSGTWEYRVSR